MKVTVERETPKPVVPPIKSVILELTEEEAKTLRVLSGSIAGNGQAGNPVIIAGSASRNQAIRPLTDALWVAFREAGIQ